MAKQCRPREAVLKGFGGNSESPDAFRHFGVQNGKGFVLLRKKASRCFDFACGFAQQGVKVRNVKFEVKDEILRIPSEMMFL